MPWINLIPVAGFLLFAMIAIVVGRRMAGKVNYVALGGKVGSEALGRASKGDLSAYAEMLRTAPDWDTRTFMAEAVGQRAVTHVVAQWAEREPNSPDAQLTWGSRLIDRAWEARGGGTRVTDNGAAQFRDLLSQADAALQRAAALRPDDPTPWALRIRCARGLSCSSYDLI